MAETGWTPVIISATLTPNPAVVGQSVVLSVIAIDVFGVETEESLYSGEFYAGEV